MSRLPKAGGCGGGCGSGAPRPTDSRTGIPRTGPQRGIPRGGAVPRSSGYGRPPPSQTSRLPPQTGRQPPQSARGIPQRAPPQSGLPPPQSCRGPPQSGRAPPQSGLPPPQRGLPQPQQRGLPQPQQRGLLQPQSGRAIPQSGLPPPQSGRAPPQRGLQPPQRGPSGGLPRTSGYGRPPPQQQMGRPRSGPSTSSARGPPPQGMAPMGPPPPPPPGKGKGLPKGKEKGMKEPTGPPKQYQLPPLSTFKMKKEGQSDLEKLRDKTKRRNAPEGEDSKAIREILRNMRDQEITVHEFIGVLSPYTLDNGTVLRNVLACELSSFRTMARNVYDTMTQDVSDVLINEHVQLKEASKERHAQYTDKMMRAIDEIYEYVPDFNFEKYYTDPDYLDRLFPLAKEEAIDEEADAIQMRQEAYHRLMWLRSEGDRLGEENRRLCERLKELKRRQKDQMHRAGDIEKTNEEKRKQLEKTQEALEEQLDVMNTSIEKSIVEQERMIREQEDVLPPRQKREKKKLPSRRRPPGGKPVENWNVKAAAEIEESATTEALVAEVSKVSMASTVSAAKGVLTKSSTGAIPKTTKAKLKKKFKFSKPKMGQDQDPFHYSPIKTPPRTSSATGRSTSPFHFSPPRSPQGGWPQQQMEPQMDEAAGGGRMPQMETTRVQASTTSRGETRQLEPPRRSRAPRDSWGGF